MVEHHGRPVAHGHPARNPAEARLHAEDGLGDGGEETEVGADEGALEEVWHVEGEEVGVERHQLEGEVPGVHHLGQALLLDEGAEGGQALNGYKGLRYNMVRFTFENKTY